MTLQLNYLNLGNYNFGTLTLPATDQEINSFFKKINPNDNDLELQWIETELNNSHLDKLSFDQLKDLSEMDQDEAEMLINIYEAVDTFDEALEIYNNGEYMIYNDCSDMSDVAYQWYEETGQLAELEKHINASYINWEAIGRDMEIEGNFHYLGNSTYIQVWY